MSNKFKTQQKHYKHHYKAYFPTTLSLRKFSEKHFNSANKYIEIKEKYSD